MPYSGPDDPKLPERIRGLSATKRRAFVAAFNSASEDHRDGEDAAERERRAFATANAAANRAGKSVDDDLDEEGSKYGGDMAVMLGIEPPPFAAGATSFADLDRYNEQSRRENALSVTFSQFEMLLSNVMRNESLTGGQRVARMRQLVEELGPRVETVTRNPEIAFRDTSEESLTGASNESSATAPSGDSSPGLGTFGGGLTAFKDKHGDWRWVSVHSNRYRDREGEIFPEIAHREFVARVDATGEFPPLYLWHTPVAEIGRADQIDYADGFVVATGTFNALGVRAAERLAEYPGALGCSHGFSYDRSWLKGSVYDRYHTFEITVLPLEYAANTLTAFDVSAKEALMPLTGPKRDFFVAALGEEDTRAIESRLDALRQHAETQGIDFKSLFEGVGAKSAEPIFTPVTEAVPAAESIPADSSAASDAPAPEAAAAVADAPATADAPSDGGESAAPDADNTAADGTEAAEPTASVADALANAPLPPSIEAGADDAQTKALGDLFRGIIGDAIAPVVERLTAVEAQTKALAESDDTKIASMFLPRAMPGVAPMESRKHNVVDPNSDLAKSVDSETKSAEAQLTAQEKALDPYVKALRGVLANPVAAGGD